MALIRCSECGRASIDVDRKCQFCGVFLKISIWTRKLRRKEAYGFLLIVTGSFLLPQIKDIGIFSLLLGFTVAGSSFLKRRVPYNNRPKVFANHAIWITDTDERLF
jgi:hypothetical protein